ncbi:hypothetical protein Trydic_g9274 [Trypoxylus dichotomus]
MHTSLLTTTDYTPFLSHPSPAYDTIRPSLFPTLHPSGTMCHPRVRNSSSLLNFELLITLSELAADRFADPKTNTSPARLYTSIERERREYADGMKRNGDNNNGGRKDLLSLFSGACASSER